MYKIGIWWHIVAYIVEEMLIFFLIILHWPLSLSKSDKVRKAGNSEFHQHQQLLLLSIHSTRAALAGQVLTRL